MEAAYMGVYKTDFLNDLDRIQCFMEEEIKTLDREESDLLERLAKVREERYVKQLVYASFLQHRSNTKERY
jgi:chaperonin cofactor prefoldin